MCVLLVEDEPLIREVMAECLLDAGYEVVDVDNGPSAVQALRNPAVPFSILVTDFHMPGEMDGSQVAARFRDVNPGLPVIIASGRPDILQSRWSGELGYSLLRKPYLPSELVALVRSMVGQPSRK